MPVAKLDEIRALIGKDLGVSTWLMVDQERIDKFADATDDHQFIHVDPEMAKQTPLGGTIAHGLLTLSLLSVMLAEVVPVPDSLRMGLNYGFNKVRFLAPVRSGKRIRGRFKLLDYAEKQPGQWLQTVEVTVEIEGEDKPALIAEWMALFYA